MEVTKIINSGDKLKIDFANESGQFKMVVDPFGDNEPSPDLSGAIAAMRPIFARRLDLEGKSQSLSVTGLETGNDQRGDWYRIHGLYWAHMCAHDLVTPKMREMAKGQEVPVASMDQLIQFVEQNDQESFSNDYPEYLTDDELMVLLTVLIEAKEFVGGKRMQSRFDFGGKDDDDYNENDHEAKA